MFDLEEKLLNKLLDKYEHSKLSKNGTTNRRNIVLKADDEIFLPYLGIDSYKYSTLIENLFNQLEKKNFVKIHYQGDVFVKLTLNLDNVFMIYQYLGRTSKRDENGEVLAVLEKYHFDNFLNDFIEYIKSYIEEKYTYPRNYFSDAGQLDLILFCFSNLFVLQEEIRERDFSAKYLGDSKLFSLIKNRIVRIIEDFDDVQESQNVLSKYNVCENSSYVLLKNGLIFEIGGQIIDLNLFGFEFSLSDEMIKHLNILSGTFDRVVTVENLTSFYQFVDKGALVIYLAGFHNHTRQLLLNKIYEKFNDVAYFHFGDIDVGGFNIFVNLRRKTQIPFLPLYMGVKEVENSKVLKKLSDKECFLLQKMIADDDFFMFREVIAYMLKYRVKMEQETLD